LGDASVINYTGSGHAVQAYTEGSSNDARVEIESVRIVGTTSGLSGIRLVAYNGTTMRDVTVTGFKSGDGFRSEGANEVDCYSCVSQGNFNGVRSGNHSKRMLEVYLTLLACPDKEALIRDLYRAGFFPNYRFNNDVRGVVAYLHRRWFACTEAKAERDCPAANPIKPNQTQPTLESALPAAQTQSAHQ